MKTTLNLKLNIYDMESVMCPFSVAIGYKANGMDYTMLSTGHETIIEAVGNAMQLILDMAPNGEQEELDDFKRRYP